MANDKRELPPQAAPDADERAVVPAVSETKERPTDNRRTFLTGLATFTGAIAAGGVAGGIVGASAKEGDSPKSRILARVRQELDNEYLNDPMTYHKGLGYDEYTKIDP